MTAYDIGALKAALGTIKVEDHPTLVKQKSRDFFWYSPQLKRELDHVTGDLVVSPKSEAEIVEVLRACYRLGIPVTPRGSGTGNYGQAMPLAGGVVLSLAEMNAVKEIAPGRLVAEPGAILQKIDRQAKAHSGQELRVFPSTYGTATIGGFIAGGSGGVGSINWGGLRDIGNVIRLRVVTMEAEPRVVDLAGWELARVTHAYGTNGIITEVEVPLTAAYDWVDVVVGLDDFLAAARYGDELGNQDGILTKLITPIAAPVPYDYFLRYRKFFRREQSAVLVMVAPHAMSAFEAFNQKARGTILYRSDTADDATKAGLPPVYELAWNHTTLRALRIDPTITYLQVLYPFPDQLEKVKLVTEAFGDEVPGHLEYVRFDGKVTCFGLPLLRYTTQERLDEIMRIHEDLGCPIFNPHRYTLEEGGMKQTDRAQLDFKRQTDPRGLLNPGKMVAWENPDFDFSTGKTYLFRGLQPADS
ncbi:MAG: FAD-binding oxidoreductase [Bauldia sp.]|nr:FAD-binding oxidoreductase [Bauldia sp.]